ncbi:MAG: hypothetical protein ACHBN1_18315 [Heteroscytonema crispum UTEX LB 1556]
MAWDKLNIKSIEIYKERQRAKGRGQRAAGAEGRGATAVPGFPRLKQVAWQKEEGRMKKMRVVGFKPTLVETFVLNTACLGTRRLDFNPKFFKGGFLLPPAKLPPAFIKVYRAMVA